METVQALKVTLLDNIREPICSGMFMITPVEIVNAFSNFTHVACLMCILKKKKKHS